ncbi:MAG: antitoxin [Thermoleophilaceae bacterium]|nr:antitoxin [Thermoleophilaceae bacterium]
MRTTVTLEPDVEALIRKLMQERGISFKTALNQAVRLGLTTKGGQQRFETQSRSMGRREGVDLTKAHQLAGELEDEEILRKMSLRK